MIMTNLSVRACWIIPFPFLARYYMIGYLLVSRISVGEIHNWTQAQIWSVAALVHRYRRRCRGRFVNEIPPFFVDLDLT